MRIRYLLSIVLFAFGPVAGCGGGTSQNPTGTAGGGSATTTTGAGGSMSGAGGSGAGPRPAAALSFYLTTATMPANARCTPGAHWVNIPFSPMGGQTTTASSRGAIAVDGVADMGVKCSVKDGGGLFEVSAELASAAFDPMGKPVNPTIATLHTTIAPNGVGALGSVSITDSKTASTFSSETCSFSVRNQPPNSLDIAPGRVWASVTCPTFRDPASPDMDAVCQIATGFFTLENCDR